MAIRKQLQLQGCSPSQLDNKKKQNVPSRHIPRCSPSCPPISRSRAITYSLVWRLALLGQEQPDLDVPPPLRVEIDAAGAGLPRHRWRLGAPPVTCRIAPATAAVVFSSRQFGRHMSVPLHFVRSDVDSDHSAHRGAARSSWQKRPTRRSRVGYPFAWGACGPCRHARYSVR